jgi:hypothetical protein
MGDRIGEKRMGDSETWRKEVEEKSKEEENRS